MDAANFSSLLPEDECFTREHVGHESESHSEGGEREREREQARSLAYCIQESAELERGGDHGCGAVGVWNR